MIMSRTPFIFLAFLQVYGMALWEINITQEPNIMRTTQGDNVTMRCHWNSEDSQHVRVQWRKRATSTEEANGTMLCSVRRSDKNNHSEVRNNMTCSVTENTTLLSIAGVTKDDVGLYVCEVTKEIPRLKKAKGNGTQVHVEDKNNSSYQLRSSVSAIVLIPIVALTVYFLCKRKKVKSKKIPKRKRQEHIELNQIHQDAAVAEEDSNSSNSVQWAVSTLYESFDYFTMKNPAASSSDNLPRPETTEESSVTTM